MNRFYCETYADLMVGLLVDQFDDESLLATTTETLLGGLFLRLIARL